MSDYVRNKAIVYPVSDIEAGEIDKLLGNEFKDLSYWNNPNNIGFALDAFDTNELRYYLTYILYHTYGEESGDFGTNRTLREDEEKYWSEKFDRIFRKIDKAIDPKKLKYVDWCYYNACESLDYYIVDQDDNTIEMDKNRNK